MKRILNPQSAASKILFKRVLAAFGLSALVLSGGILNAASPDFSTSIPRGGKAGSEVKVTIMGNRLSDAEEILFHQPGMSFKDLKVVDDKKVALPPKSEVYSNIEALMNHFKLVYDGILPPPGEVYGYTEGANGELGFYIVSRGAKYPWRVKVRPPCYNIYQAFPSMITGGLLADAIAIIGGLNVIAGELDR